MDIEQSCGHCSILNPNELNAPSKTFSFDGAYGVDSTTEEIYNEIVFPLVEVWKEFINTYYWFNYKIFLINI